MSQSDGRPAWQGKTYSALEDKKNLTGINKEEELKRGLFSSPTSLQSEMALRANDYHQKCAQKRQGHKDPAYLYNLIIQESLNHGLAFLGYQESSPNPKWPDTHNYAYDIGKETPES